MESNETSIFMDVKLNINDKRPDTLKFKNWTRCQVKIEAIKCLPCFLRITFTEWQETAIVTAGAEEQKSLTVSINVPGVSISLAASRTKQYSYGLFWTQNRRDCFIYFALDTETSCRHHMRWLKKSIKNLELYRQVFLEQRRNSRGPGRFGVHAQDVTANKPIATTVADSTTHLSVNKPCPTTLGPLPQIPVTFDGNNSSWSRHASRISEIYEEIFEDLAPEPAHLARRHSRTSIASGIYEEMKFTSRNFNAIVEEIADTQLPPTPPPLPPLPVQRKRINTFETEPHGLLGEIPRSNTNPESELAKKKKYKNVLENIFGSGRSKRAKSVSESHACSVDDVVDCNTPTHNNNVPQTITSPGYANEVAAAKRPKKHQHRVASNMSDLKRNSFSSPDLSKINFLDTLNEGKVADILQSPFGNSVMFDLSSQSLDDSLIQGGKSEEKPAPQVNIHKVKTGSLESCNISQQIPSNFNFSACNTSTINLVGANGAVPAPPNPLKNKILIDDLTGYCIMAPIRPKKPATLITSGNEKLTAQPTQLPSTESGYSTGSTNSAGSNCNEEHLASATVQLRQQPVAEEAVIYANMIVGSNGCSESPTAAEFTGNLYENLLAVKAAQELEQPITTLSTSTPTESPHMPALVCDAVVNAAEDEENYYQTPRKSIISVDDKIPSYYPNSNDTVKMRRASQSPAQGTPTTASEKTPHSIGFRQLVSIKLRRERKENVYISPTHQIGDQHDKSCSPTGSTDTTSSHKSNKSNKTKKTAAHKISESVYAVTHAHKKLNNNNTKNAQAQNTETVGAFNADLREKLQKELLQLAQLQSIDFKFDDTKALLTQPSSELPQLQVKGCNAAAGEEAENCYQSHNEAAAHLLHKYAQLSPRHAVQHQRSPSQHHLQLNQELNTQRQSPVTVLANANNGTTSSGKPTDRVAVAMTQSKLVVTPVASGDVQWRKFTSLPRFKKIDFSPLKLKINNVLQRNQQQDF